MQGRRLLRSNLQYGLIPSKIVGIELMLIN